MEFQISNVYPLKKQTKFKTKQSQKCMKTTSQTIRFFCEERLNCFHVLWKISCPWRMIFIVLNSKQTKRQTAKIVLLLEFWPDKKFLKRPATCLLSHSQVAWKSIFRQMNTSELASSPKALPSDLKQSQN